MMKRRYIILIILCITCIVASVGFFCSKRERALIDICPAIETGIYHATLNWFGSTEEDHYSCHVLISDEEFRSLLATVQIKKGATYMVEPTPAFCIHLFDGGNRYSITIGSDSSISIASLDDLEERTFWNECNENIFSILYACHLKNGGMKIPERQRDG